MDENLYVRQSSLQNIIERRTFCQERLIDIAFKDEIMKRAILYVAGVLMTAGGLFTGCAHDRCGSGGCPANQTYAPGPGPSGIPQGSGTPQYRPADGGVPTYTSPAPSYNTPAPGSGSTGGFGGSGSR